MSCRQALLDLLWETVYTYTSADRAVMYGKPGYFGYKGVNRDPISQCFVGKVKEMIWNQHRAVMDTNVGLKAGRRVMRGEIDALQVFANFVGILDLPDKLNVTSIDRLFRKKFHGAPEKLLVDIQYLHDRPEHWTPEGVSKAGMVFAKTVHDTWVDSDVWVGEPPYVHKNRRKRRKRAAVKKTTAKSEPSARPRRESHMYGPYAVGRYVFNHYGPWPYTRKR